MPSATDGLKVFLRKENPDIKDWLSLLEARAELLKPYLDSITLPTLGRLRCLRHADCLHEVQLDKPVLFTDNEFSLMTQGIFSMQPQEAVQYVPGTGYQDPRGIAYPDGMVYAWGLTRSKKWVLAEIHFSGQEGTVRGYEKAEIVKINEADLVTIIQSTRETPKEMWFKLGEEARELVKRRQRLLNEALELERVVDAEETAFYIIRNATREE